MTADPTVCILLIDDHALVRAALRMMLESSLPDVFIVEAGSIGELAGTGRQQAALQPNLILLDIELPGLNGLAGLAVLRRRWAHVPVMVLTSHTQVEVRESALALGVDGFMSKAEAAATMLASIRALLQGKPEPHASTLAAAASPHLTPRQCEVLDLLCQGLTNKVIGLRMGVSENTIRGHVQGLLATLGVASRAEAVIAARERGMVR